MDDQSRSERSESGRRTSFLIAWRRCLSAVRRHDCIHLDFDLSASSVKAGIFLLAVAGYLGKRTVISLSSITGDNAIGFRGRALGRMLRAADVVVVGSEEAERQLSRFNAKVRVVPQIALAQDSRAIRGDHVQPRLALAAPIDTVILRSVIRGLALTKQKYPRAELAIMGTRTQLNAVRSHLVEMSLNGVELVVCRDDQEAIRALQSCDVYLETSSQADPTPALVEALALGIPVIGIDTAGMIGSITHGVNGLEIAAGDHVDLANRLCDLVESPDLVRTLSSGAAELAGLHERTLVIAAWAQLYSTVATSGQTTSHWPRRISPQYHTTVKA